MSTNRIAGKCLSLSALLLVASLPASAQWSTSGTTVFYTGGRVGIGTSAPLNRLHVVETLQQRVGVFQNQNGLVGLGIDPSGGYLQADGINFSFFAGAQRVFFGSASSGFVGIGTTTPTQKLHVVGNAIFTGTVTGGNISATYQDVAEWVPVSARISAGTLVVLDELKVNHVMPSFSAYDTKVAGVVSAQPGLILGIPGDDKSMIATTGRVKLKADASRGSIRIGDLLVSSPKAGYAMRSEPVKVGEFSFHRPGTIVGKALEPLASGDGEILVLLSLQ